ncbi:TlpA disulfide reductase family protein [uncultured Chitinophaga sp.]|uniref:TlpA disulfide reductase family protein n=1 Tax=uncultured Chitinophaga sp. TaxID=339340 RepID=UPI0025FBDECD|nr:TlpA disulfide reductase family protein [uncultured Chitinophaga sp.]
MKLFVCCLLAGLCVQTASAQSYTISGKLEGLKNDTVFLVTAEKRNGPRDTAFTIAKNGAFSFKGQTKEVKMTTLMPTSLRSRKFFNFYLEPGKIKLEGDLEKMDYIRANGTYNNDLQTQSRQKEEKQYALMQQFRDEKKADEASRLYDEIWADKRDFIRKHPKSYVSLINLWVLQSRVPLDTTKALFALLPPNLKQTDYGQHINEQLVARERVRIGKEAPAFEAVDVNGNKLSLASLRGKYVLLDFWASWCVPCRAENPHVVAAYEQFKDKGFTVVSVSLDHDKAKWIEAIAKDQLNWTHISELKASQEPVAKLYGIQAIPDNFLVAPDGRIVAAQLRGEVLKTTLAQFIK